MEQKEIKITVEKGWSIKSMDARTGVILIEKDQPNSIMERIKTFDDVLRYQGFPSSHLFQVYYTVLTENELAYIKLKLIASCLNEGWEPDWSDLKQLKYYPLFKMGGSSGFRFLGYDVCASALSAGTRVCFKSRELAGYAGKTFVDIYKDFMCL
jgi:hypothetical protein